MPRRRSIGFIVIGLICIVAGITALADGALPTATVARWMAPALLLVLGGAGIVRWWPRPPANS